MRRGWWLVVVLVSVLTLGMVHAQDLRGTSIEIDLEEQLAYLVRDGQVVLATPISSGRSGYETSRGAFKIIEKERNHFSNLYGRIVDARGKTIVADADADMPVPRGGRFVAAPMRYFMRFSGAEGMHAGVLPGYAASHGCVRLPEANAVALFNAVDVGTPVNVFGRTRTRRARNDDGYSSLRRRPVRLDGRRDPRFDERFFAPAPAWWR